MRGATRRTLGTLAVLACALRVTPAAAQVVTGTVRDGTTGRPVAAVTVALLTIRDSVLVVSMTDDSGRFRLTAPGPGRYELGARQLGLHPRRDTLPLLAAGDTIVQPVVMTRIPAILDTVRVAAKRGYFELVPGREQFARHARQSKSGYFVSAREIEWSGLPLSDYLAKLPGFFKRPRLSGQAGIRTDLGDLLQANQGESGCIAMRVDRMGFGAAIRNDELEVLLPRHRSPPGMAPPREVYVRLSEIEAFEVYHDRRDIPDEWKMLADRCTFVQVWTRVAW